MIISASRRTDIPSYYSNWFMNRLSEGFVYVRNPMNAKQVSKISLSKDDVECMVFWTKNPYPMLKHLEALEAYNYYFQFTLTGYDGMVELNLPPKSELVPIFNKLSSKLGKDRVIWRYDPILLSGEMTVDKHLERFELLASKLKDSTSQCIFSFLETYPSIMKKIESAGIYSPGVEVRRALVKGMSEIGRSYNLKLATCSDSTDYSVYNISHSKCIDDDLINSLFNLEGLVPKDSNQRKACGCVKSIDIGAYNTCHHGCIYCYANHHKTIQGPESEKAPMLTGSVNDQTKINNRKVDHYFSKQIRLIQD